jgi:hypothetical protein
VGKEKLGRKMVFSQFWLLISPLDNWVLIVWYLLQNGLWLWISSI